MKRLLVAFVAAALLVPLQSIGAQAGNSSRETYKSTWINIFWHSRKKVDENTYLTVTWYAGAYSSAEEVSFWSDLYRSVRRCEKRDGRDRCRYVRRKSLYGVSRKGIFTIDRKLSTSHLEASYKLRRYVDGEPVDVGTFSVVADAAGTGHRAHGRSTYTYHEGCVYYSYSGKWVSRQAIGTGTLAKDDGDPRDLGETSDAWIGRSDSVDFGHTC